jgi:hypothetical protein
MSEQTSQPEIDLVQAPLGVRAAGALVAAVAALDDRVERHYLEVKSDLDLGKKSDLGKVAKYILGSANRLPAVAATAFEGYGVMVIGVAPGDARGVPPIEILEIEKVVGQYLGAAGPRWDLVRVAVTGSPNEVLIVVVDPPLDGQGPFPCRREGDGLMDGRVYIRVEGETREAKSAELDLLIERGRRNPAADVSFSVEIVGSAFPVSVKEVRTIDVYVLETRDRLIDAITKSPTPTPMVGADVLDRGFKLNPAPQSILSGDGLLGAYGTNPETRTKDQYLAAIDRWESEVRQEWPSAIDVIAGRVLRGVSIRVSNPTKTFFNGVELKVHLEGDVRGIEWVDGERGVNRVALDLPQPPRAWGPVSTLPDLAGIGIPYLPPSGFSSYSSPLDWRNGGSVDLTLNVGELRPMGTYDFEDDELVLILPSGTTDAVQGAWAITAKDHNEVFTGILSVALGEPIELTNELVKLLRLGKRDR